MKAFDQLTPRGQARRLRALAVAALSQYPLKVASVQGLGVFTNTLYRVRAQAGARYVLRVCQPGWRTATDLLSEALWLEALAGAFERPHLRGHIDWLAPQLAVFLETGHLRRSAPNPGS